jgi:hypothetical protein
VCGIVV